MWPFATRSRRRPDRADERGSVLVSTIALTGILALLVIVSLSYAQSGRDQTAHDSRGDIALAAADAGINQYVSRLVEDDYYFWRYVDVTEDPRVASNGTVYCPGAAWTPGFDTTWTYTAPATACGNRPRTWTSVQDGSTRYGGAEYGLRVTPPRDTGLNRVTILATGRVGGGRLIRSIQSQVQPNSLAEFQAISDASISYGGSARTTGKIWSKADVNHNGVAEAPVYAGRYACTNPGGGCSAGSPKPSTVFTAGAWDSTTTPKVTEVITPPDFSTLTGAITTLKTVAQAFPGGYYNDSAATAWFLVFTSDGRVQISRVTGTTDPGAAPLGTVGSASNVTVPAAGAMYFEQPVIVSGPGAGQASVVGTRVTVASAGNIYVGGNISYASNQATLGLISKLEVIIAKYAPDVLTWRAATLAQGGQWRTYDNAGDHASMTYTGSQAMKDGGYATMYRSRTYAYDRYLLSVRPPYYPFLKGSWQTVYWREVTPPV